MTSLIHIVGARPNFMKAAPVVDALERIGVDQILIHTGQHYDSAMSQVFFDELGLPEPDRYLGVGSGSHGVQTVKLLEALETEFINVPSFSYDLSADDERFLVLLSDAQRPEITHLNLVVNWFEELKGLVPTDQ